MPTESTRESTPLPRASSARSPVVDTFSLITAFNDTDTHSERTLYRKWLKKYIELFNCGEVNDAKEIESFALLATIKCHNDEDRKLIKHFVVGLISKIQQQQSSEAFISAMDYATNVIFLDNFEEIHRDLLTLAKFLLEEIAPYVIPFTKSNYKTHGTIIYAVHRILTRLSEIRSPEMNQNFLDKFSAKLTAIEEWAQHYFPYKFHCKVMEMALKDLAVENFLNPLVEWSRCLFHLETGNLDSVHRIEDLDIKMDAIGQGLAVDQKLVNQRFLIIQLASLFDSTRKTIIDQDFEHFRSKYEELKMELFMNQKTEKMVEFSMVLLLRLLATVNPSEELHKMAVLELLRLGSLSEEWVRIPEIFEALMEALYDIHQRGLYDDSRMSTVFSRLEQILCRSDLQALQKKFNEWKGTRTIEERLQRDVPAQTVDQDTLFLKVQQAIEMDAVGDEDEVSIQLLKQYYRKTEFAEVKFVLKSRSIFVPDSDATGTKCF